MPLAKNGGGILPRNALVSFLAACTIASAGANAGFLMYLCLKITDSDPRTDNFSRKPAVVIPIMLKGGAKVTSWIDL